MTTPLQLAPGQAEPEVSINENNDALGQAFLWAHDKNADSGLVVALAGGIFNGNAVADATVTCTDNATNYIVAHRTTRAISVATTTTNWNTTATYGRVARAVFASGVLTFDDERRSVGGIFDHSSALGAGDALVANPLSQFAATTSAQLAGVISDETGSGALVFGTGPTLSSPIVGTQSPGDNSTKAASTAYVAAAVAAGTAGIGTGDVVGPGSAVANHVATFNGTTGKLIKDSGLTLAGTNTGDETTTTAGALINGATAKTTPVDADFVGLMDSAASNVLKKLSWASVKATLKTYFDTLYSPLAQPFDAHAFYPGVPSASAKVLRVPIARAVTFAANFSGSYFAASANATATTVFDVQKNGSSIGSVSIAAGGTTATFTTTSGTSKSFAAGDVLAIIAPGTADATLADVGFVLAGTR